MHVKDLASIKIEGRCFSVPAVLKLFPGKKQRVSFVLGKNGSGKSTISTAVRGAIAGSLPDGIVRLNLLDQNDLVLNDEPDVLQSTFVFNESFVEENIRVSENGLQAIVMIGETGDLTDRIDKASQDLQAASKELDEAQKLLTSMRDSSNPLSVQFHKTQIYRTLSSLGGWGDREKEIRSLKRAASVSDNVQNTIVQLQLPSEPKEQLENEYRAAMANLGQLNEGDELSAVPSLPSWLLQINEDKFVYALERVIDHPDLTERDKHILSLVEKEGSSNLLESRKYFEAETNGICPFCLRDIDEDEKADLFATISALLNEEADRHSGELSSLITPVFAMDLTDYEKISKNDVDAANALIEDIQNTLAFFNAQLELKSQNLYSPVSVEDQHLQDSISKLNAVLATIEEARQSWNRDIKNKQHVVENLQALNKKIARIEINSSIEASKKAEADETKQGEVVHDLEEKVKALVSEKSKLEAQKSSINIALDDINESLAFIFLSKDRLVLSGEHGEYALYSRGEKVRPCDVSAGERNAIGLCYFFTLIGAGKSKEDKYSDSVFVLIDDPISSLDQDNRIGILSYLRYQLFEIVAGNRYSKATVFTHDGYCMNAFEKMCKELVNRSVAAGPRFAIHHPETLELSDRHLIKWKLDAMRYTELVGLMYDYAISPNDQQRPLIGNISRKVLEAFATFEFSMGLSEFADSSTVLETIANQKLKDYFGRLMFSIVLHSESHTSDPVKIEGVIETAREYASSEIDRIVRDSLLLIYCINRKHVLTHLKDKDGAQGQLDSWVGELENM